MAAVKQDSFTLLHSFASIFYLCKMLGIYPQEWRAFCQNRRLQKSTLGTVFVLVVMVFNFVCFNCMVYAFEDVSFSSAKNNLDLGIGFVLTYISLSMMITDQITALRNQQEVGVLFDRIHAVDEELLQHNVVLDNRSVARHIHVLITLAATFESTIFFTTYLILVDRTDWKALLWMFSCVPTFYNTLDKIWFASLLMGVKQRFAAINTSLEQVVERHDRLKKLKANRKYLKKDSTGETSSVITRHLGTGNLHKVEPSEDLIRIYWHREPSGHPICSLYIIDSIQNYFGECLEDQHQLHRSDLNLVYDSDLNNVAVIEQKFISLCQLHDDICGIAKTLNELWCYPLLMLMAYGFLIVIAQLYFLYCATENQVIPSLFRQAKMFIISMVYLTYVIGKCVSVLFLSWKTVLESRRAGICLHKCAVASDTNAVYEIVNHLSLKFLNHAVNFSACGFFTLDMENLFAICGGITTYLIILIQFNMANLQAQVAKTLTNNTDVEEFTAIGDNATNYMNYSFYLSGLFN